MLFRTDQKKRYVWARDPAVTTKWIPIEGQDADVASSAMIPWSEATIEPGGKPVEFWIRPLNALEAYQCFHDVTDPTPVQMLDCCAKAVVEIRSGDTVYESAKVRDTLDQCGDLALISAIWHCVHNLSLMGSGVSPIRFRGRTSE